MYVQAPCRSFGMVCTQLHVLVAAEAQALSGASVTEQPRCLPLGARSGRARTEAAAGAAPQQVASNVTCKTGTMPDMASPTQSTHTDRRLLLSLSNAHMAITVNSQRQRNSRSNTPSIGALIIFFFFFFLHLRRCSLGTTSDAGATRPKRSRNAVDHLQHPAVPL